MGASRKGRLWSHQREDLVQFATWCKKVGTKLIDPTINPGEVLRNAHHPNSRPASREDADKCRLA